jgi:hypothetical protein
MKTLLSLGFLLASFAGLPAADAGTPAKAHLADYDSELRRVDGRVDVDAMVRRLQELGVGTYYWLIWHAPTDWDDLKVFLPKARQVGLEVWVYLVPPSEGSGSAGPPSQPFGLDFLRWAEEIARLSLEHTNLTGWVIDDFYANHETLSPAYVGQMQSRAKRINPRLAFLPLMYFNEITPRFVQQYRPVIDGVVVAYLQARAEIERTWAILNDAGIPPASELTYPWNTPSREADYAMASQTATVVPGDRCVIHFRERDDFTGPTAGYHFKQVLVEGKVLWEADVAGGGAGWNEVSVDATAVVRGRTNVTVGFRLLDKQGVSNFGVRWQLGELRSDTLHFAADFLQPQNWGTRKQGHFETGFGQPATPGERRFHIPFISMTAGDAQEFRQRHGDPASPERIADWLRMSLQAWRDGRCDRVVTYCLDKSPQSMTLPLAQKLFREFRKGPL